MKQLIVSIVCFLCLMTACVSSDTATISSNTSSATTKTTTGAGAASGVAQAAIASAAINPYLAAGVLIPLGAKKGFKAGSLQLPTDELIAAGGMAYQLGQYVTIVLPADSVFVPTASETTREGDRLLAAAVRIIRSFPENDILITVHTDGVGRQLWQAKRSYAQAKEVALKLWSMGAVPNNQLTRYHYAGIADTQPIANPQSGRGMALNRRVAITLFPSQDQAAIGKAVNSFGIGEMKTLEYRGF